MYILCVCHWHMVSIKSEMTKDSDWSSLPVDMASEKKVVACTRSYRIAEIISACLDLKNANCNNFRSLSQNPSL